MRRVIKEDDLLPHKQNKSCIERMKLWHETDYKIILLRLYSLIQFVVTTTPTFIAAMMAICRFLQIKFPFLPLQIKHILPLASVYGIYALGMISYALFDKHGVYTVQTQVYTHDFHISNDVVLVFVYSWPGILCQVSSVTTSLLTIRHLCNIRNNPVSAEAGSATVSIRSSVKILINNFGSVFTNTIMATCLISARKRNTQLALSLFISTVLAPVLLSCFNPIVFILFTPNFSLKQKSRPS